MEETTLTIDESVKQRLEEHRTDGHSSWSDLLTGMMAILPTPDEFRECSWRECEKNIYTPAKPEDGGGVIQFAAIDHGDETIRHSAFFCSHECVYKAQEEANSYVPEEPDLVVVGGKNELRAELKGATFYLDGAETMEVGIDAPGAFAGSSSHGREYDYVGEPVYVKNEGQWVQSGVVDEIIHGEAHTALLLKQGGRANLYHPDDEKRESTLDSYCHWYTMVCPHCEADLRVREGMDAIVECGECETSVEREAVPEHEIPEVVREHRADQ